ncbi:MAG: aromatic hydrocarbon degradation protein [Gammaproteobacteria bacterium]|nr:aromatic hydrocarbon degradation protein [Gammaproteobacteria bacterium]
MTIKPRYTLFKLTGLLCCTSLISLGSSVSHAAGFAIIEQSVSGLGNAYAGSAARAEDAGTIYFNPAGMTFLSGRQAIAGLYIIKPSAKFTNDGSNISPGSGDGGDAGTIGVIPNLYYVMDINKEIKFGLGINVPFGLATEYDKNWRGRYQAVNSEVSAININPSLAFKANDQWSFGLGVSLQYIEAELTNAVDFGTICLGLEQNNGGPLSNGTCTSIGLNPQASDGFSKIAGDDWGVGFNLGVIYSLSDATRIGLAYRSEVKQNLDGKADFTLPAAAQSIFSTAFADTGVSAKIDLPDTTALSAYHQLNDRWALLADITWTGWSSFKELKIEFDNPAKSPSVEEENWDDSTRYSLAVNFMPNAQWIYRAGLAFDETPIPNDEMRTARIPGSDRTWLAFGAGYAPTKNFQVDIAYVHILVDDVKINRAGATGDILRGSYESSVDILGAQARWVF